MVANCPRCGHPTACAEWRWARAQRRWFVRRLPCASDRPSRERDHFGALIEDDFINLR